MRRNRALLVVLMLGALIALWLILSPPRAHAPVDNLAIACSIPKTRPSSVPFLAPGKPAVVVEKPVPEPTAAPDVAPPEDSVVAPQALWDPDYGPRLQRGGARAEFTMVDARGRVLDADQPRHVRLWRKIGSYWLGDEAHHDAGRDRVVCDGLSNRYAEEGAGLEAGEYELEVSCGGYGAVRQAFSIVEGQTLSGILRLPNWRRVVCLRIVDQRGAAVLFLYQDPAQGPPYVLSESLIRLQGVKRDAPASLLRSRPGRPEQLMGIGGMSGGAGYTPRWKTGKIHTHQGNYYLRVFAGADNTIKIPLLPEIWGSEMLVINSDCTGAEWDNYVITLTLPDDFETRLEQKTERGGRPVNLFDEVMADNPGNRSLIEVRTPAPRPPTVPDDPRELSGLGEGRVRLLLRADGMKDVFPLVDARHGVRITRFAGARQHEDWWVFDADSQFEMNLRWSDGKLLETPPQPLEFSGGRLIERIDTLDVVPLDIRLRVLSPTLAHFTHTAVLADVSGRREKISFSVTAGRREHDGMSSSLLDGTMLKDSRTPALLARVANSDDFVLRTALSRVDYEKFAAASTRWNFSVLGAGHRRERIRFLGVGDHQRRSVHAYWEGVGDSVAAAGLLPTAKPLEGSRVELEAAGSGLMLRAVGESAGLPWVQGVLLSIDDDDISRAIRKRALELAAQGKSLPRLDDVALEESAFEPDDPDEGFGDEELRKKLGDEAWELFKSRAEREFFFLNGAWYDPRLRVQSDSHGYIVAPEILLQPGKRYVLYLWSASRDEYTPDRRIEFIAGNGWTDLGAVPLPDYR